MPRIDLLHMLGDVPEGPWAIFSLPHGDGTEMVSVVVPRSLWVLLTRSDPFTSEIALMERVGTHALERALTRGEVNPPIFVQAQDIGTKLPVTEQWFDRLRQCGVCGQSVPAGEVLEGLANALPPDSRGEISLKVLCPDCQIQTDHRLTPWGIP